MPDPPKHLSAKAKKEWKRIAPELLKVGLLTKIDGPALAAYCDYYGQWAQASQGLKKTGILIKGALGEPMINPLLKIINSALDGMRKICSDFGMTPSSRSKVKAATKPEEPEGEDYFGWAEENRN
jgi:P27 family predicted phage terminase small subunit